MAEPAIRERRGPPFHETPVARIGSSVRKKISEKRILRHSEHLIELGEATETSAESATLRVPSGRAKSTSQMDFDIDPGDDNADIPTTPYIESAIQKIYRLCCLEMDVAPNNSIAKQLDGTQIVGRHMGLNAKQARAIAVATVNTIHVHTIDLSHNCIEDKGTLCIADMMMDNQFVTHLRLAENHIQSLGLKELVNAILDNENLEELDLSGNGFGENDAEQIAKLMTENHRLKRLILAHNCFRERGGELLGPAIARNEGLKYLDLSWNHLRRKGAAAVCESLKSNIALESLNISWNGIGIEGCQVLAKVLPQNDTLRQLDLSSNRIALDALGQLLKGLSSNEGLEGIKLSQNCVTSEKAVVLLKSLEKSQKTRLKWVEIKDTIVERKFLSYYADFKKTKHIEIIYAYKFKESDGADGKFEDDSDELDGEPLMILLEFMRLSGLRLIDLFKQLDKDGSMSLTRMELMKGLIEANVPLSEKKLNELINRLDKDGDGEINYSELLDGDKEHRRKMAMMKLRANGEETELTRISVKIKALIQIRRKMLNFKSKTKLARPQGTEKEKSPPVADSKPTPSPPVPSAPSE